MNLNLLPADSYFVLNKSIISELDKQVITTLYQPIIGHSAVSLYLTLLNEVEQNKTLSVEYTHHHLMTLLQMSLNDVLSTRQKLEAVGLLKTHVKTGNINNYVYTIFSPIPVNDFFNHPVLNVVLFNNIGEKEYQKLLAKFKVPNVSLTEYEDITKKFTDVFSTVRHNKLDVEDNIIKRSSRKINITNDIDFDTIKSSLPNTLNKNILNEEMKDLIENLSFIYGLDTLHMARLIRSSIDETGTINKVELRKQARNLYQYDNNNKLPTLVYKNQPEHLQKETKTSSNWDRMVHTFENITPYDYLMAKQKGAKPTSRDLKIIEDLLINLKLTPGVVNVLLSYVLKVNDNKLNKNYVETIAAQWKRAGIKTVEDAMRYSEKEHKRITNNRNKVKRNTKFKESDRKLPEWFDEKIEKVSISDDEEEKLKELLENF